MNPERELSPERIASIQRGIKDAHEGRTQSLADLVAELGIGEAPVISPVVQAVLDAALDVVAAADTALAVTYFARLEAAVAVYRASQTPTPGECPQCDGTGQVRIIDVRCLTCDGSGVTPNPQEATK
jgi:hypothetical protein